MFDIFFYHFHTNFQKFFKGCALHLFKAILISCVTTLLALQFSYTYAAVPTPTKAVQEQEKIEKISLVWPPIASAVQYELNIIDPVTMQQVLNIKPIYAAGYELDAKSLPENPGNFLWQVRGLDYDGQPVNNYSQPQPLNKASINANSPITTTQFEQMAYTPLYPVYSWIPYLRAAKYTVRIYYGEDDNSLTPAKLINEYQVDGHDSFDFYDPASYTQAGQYYWTVQARDINNLPISRWSAPVKFYVTTQNITTAALGDSITHGGGAISTPPGYTLYDWQTYSSVPVLNLGYSGDTTAAMLQRFAKDVLPFHPRILVIMGGVNDVRTGVSAEESIQNLSAIRDLCIKNHIIPVMVTASPICPQKMQETIDITPAPDWQEQLSLLNHWILSYPGSIDTYLLLSDNQGLLKSNLTTDGLHPDATGKRIIGETIAAALRQSYPNIFAQQ